MNPERFKQLEALYDAAANLDPGERTRFIDERCAGDDELRRELLAAFDDARSGLTGLVEHAAGSAMESDDTHTGRRFGA